MKLCFDSIEEVKEFVANLKGTRGKKGEIDDAPAAAAPAPLQPPQTFNPSGFAPQGQPAAQVGGAFPAAVVGPAPEVLALVTKITARLDQALAGGQPAEQALTWFRSQCGPEAASATMDQIKGTFLPRMTVPVLENIAKLMGCA
jgi:hypothetical protein